MDAVGSPETVKLKQQNTVSMGNCFNDKPKAPDPYAFKFSSQGQLPQNSASFESNRVRTSQYTVLSFFPLALLNQFTRLANVYFLVIAVLQTIPQISPLSVYTAWIPLIIVLAISMLREAIEDIARCRTDSQTNYDSKAMVRRKGQWVEVPWSDVVVGEVCIVEQDQLFPADLILVASAVPGGNAFIQTASLDGEKSLKPRLAPQQFSPFREDNGIDQLSGECTCSTPDRSLSNFSATVVLPGAQQRVIIEGEKQLLYRGARLKNTKWIYGLVVYTGRNTKIMLNSQDHRNKMSQIEIKVNRLLIIIFAFQVVLCLVCAVCYGVETNRQISSGYWYLETPSNVAVSSLLVFFSYLVLFNTMIPISLIVSLEIVKTIQAMFIQNDVLLFSKLRSRGCKVYSASLNEELGQVEYVFTDKTGTLTLNIMEFKIAVIGENMYGEVSLINDHANTEASPQTKLPEGVKGFYDQKLIMLLSGAGQAKQIQPLQILDSQGQSGQSINSEKELAAEYMLALSIAHQCVLDQDKDGNSSYQGPSPDEITLVQAAKNTGYTFLRTDNRYSYVKIAGKDERFELLSVNPFTSDRKRMSVIVRTNNKIKLFIKGADSIIKKRLSPNQTYLTAIDKHLHIFAVKGLRTLLVAEKILTQQEYSTYKQAEQGLPEVEREKHREKLISEMEQGLTLIGATAVLDRLQDKVPDTIRDMIQANIKVWMLTGDKLETAQNIAISCNLIQPHFQVMKFVPKSQDFRAEIKQMAAQAQSYKASGVKKAFLIEGEHLAVLFKDESCKMIIVEMAQHCEAVVCCRLLPLQKAEVVKLVKDYLNKITLAIGDGANDVPMITTAHIGIGLYGEEGMGSVSASDYALPQFQSLWRLLFIHGRWNYLRISQMILYFFYKNMVFTIPQFYFAFYNSYSAQTIFDDTYVSLFNLVFTAIPLIIKAVLQQDIYYIWETNEPRPPEPLSLLPEGYEQRNSLKLLFPNIYFLGQDNKIFHYRSFFWWVFEGMLTGLLITFIALYTLSGTSLNSTGINVDLWSVSLTIYSAVILAVTFKLATHTRFWSILTFIGTVIISLGLYVAFMWVSNANSGNVQGSILPVYRSFHTWLVVFYVISILLVFDGVFVYYKFLCGGDSSRMRAVVDNDRISDYFYYDEIGLKPGQPKSQQPQGTLDVLFN